jgi:hypothetical protein
MLESPLPKSLRQTTKYRLLSDLDGSSRRFFSPQEVDLLEDAVLEAVTTRLQYMPRSIKEGKLGKLPDGLVLDDLQLKVRTVNCLKREGLTSPARLENVTVERLMALRGFGVVSLLDFLTAIEEVQSPTFVSRREVIVSEAQKLLRFKRAGAVLQGDPRLGGFLTEILLSIQPPPPPREPVGYSALEVAEILAAGATAPDWVIEALRDLRLRIRAKTRISLEDELIDFLASRPERDRRIVARRLGWDGNGGCTLEIAGNENGITRERVRQLEKKALEPLRTAPDYPFAPRLDAALELVEDLLPAPVDRIEYALTEARISEARFALGGLTTAAEILGREVNFKVSKQGGSSFVMNAASADLPGIIRRHSRRIVEHWGTGTILDLRTRVSEEVNGDVEEVTVVQILKMSADFYWLDKPSGWFTLSSVPRNRLINQVEKILSVTPRVHITELRDGVRRHHRMKGVAPPRRVLSELCRLTPGYRVEGDYVVADPPLDWVEVLADIEETMARILFEHGPLLTGSEFEKLCVGAGINRASYYAYLGYSPIIARYASQVYGLRGVEFPPGAAENLVPQGRRHRVVQDHGWSSGGQVWIAYRLTESLIKTGVIGIPAAIKQHVSGAYQLRSEEGANVGKLVAKETSAWGLGPFFARRGGEAGDAMVLTFDIGDRLATVSVGNDEILEGASGQLSAS